MNARVGFGMEWVGVNAQVRERLWKVSVSQKRGKGPLGTKGGINTPDPDL